MPLLETKGAASAQGFGGAGAGASGPVTYIEDVFSTWLYTGNGSTQTITNGIDLSGKGGLVWTKKRNSASSSYHTLIDTLRGTGSWLRTDGDVAAISSSDTITSFNASGYALGTGASYGTTNTNSDTYVSWTFREQPKFFDIVTWTGNDTPNRKITHSLGSVPGCIVVKSISNPLGWPVYHRSLNIGSNEILYLEQTAAATPTGASRFGDNASIIAPTSTEFTIGGAGNVNANGYTYIAYLFAHDAGGFGLTGSDNVISCGSYTGNGLTDGPVINLSYEPQWVMIKRTDSTGNWALIDIMRGFPNTGSAGNYDNGLLANTSGAETTTNLRVKPTSTGFSPVGGDADTNASGGTYIYIAIRRGPMKVPTSGTSVFSPTLTASNSETVNTIGFTPDMQLIKQTGNAVGTNAVDRLRGISTRYQYNDGNYLLTSSTAAEASNYSTQYWNNTGFSTPYNTAGISTIYWTFRRAPSFFDVVCYTGTGGAGSITTNHNLTVKPELMIVKRRDAAGNWMVNFLYDGVNYRLLRLNETTANIMNVDGTATTSAVFRQFQYNQDTGVADDNCNVSGGTYVTYLFATCAGVSKVGSYTGTGALQTINCGFTGGSRFVLIKRTDSTGDWYVYDSARGISSGNDPYLFLNTTAAEVTGTNYVDTTSVGFQVTAAAPSGLNANGGTYIFLAIA